MDPILTKESYENKGIIGTKKKKKNYIHSYIYTYIYIHIYIHT